MRTSGIPRTGYKNYRVGECTHIGHPHCSLARAHLACRASSRAPAATLPSRPADALHHSLDHMLFVALGHELRPRPKGVPYDPRAKRNDIYTSSAVGGRAQTDPSICQELYAWPTGTPQSSAARLAVSLVPPGQTSPTPLRPPG